MKKRTEPTVMEYVFKCESCGGLEKFFITEREKGINVEINQTCPWCKKWTEWRLEKA